MQPVTSTSSQAAVVAATVRPPQAAERVREPPPKAQENPVADVAQAARKVEKFVQAMSSDLQFSVDESSGNSIVRVIDRSTREVIRQIPSEEMLSIAQALDRIQGLLIRQKA